MKLENKLFVLDFIFVGMKIVVNIFQLDLLFWFVMGMIVE